jgi:hypothetical protein
MINRKFVIAQKNIQKGTTVINRRREIEISTFLLFSLLILGYKPVAVSV